MSQYIHFSVILQLSQLKSHHKALIFAQINASQWALLQLLLISHVFASSRYLWSIHHCTSVNRIVRYKNPISVSTLYLKFNIPKGLDHRTSDRSFIPSEHFKGQGALNPLQDRWKPLCKEASPTNDGLWTIASHQVHVQNLGPVIRDGKKN